MMLLPRFGARVLGRYGGFVVGALGFLLGTRDGVDSGYGLTAAWTASSGPGSAAALFCGQNGALAALPRERAAAGSALVQALRQIGSVAGIAVLGALLNAHTGPAADAGWPPSWPTALGRNVATGWPLRRSRVRCCWICGAFRLRRRPDRDDAGSARPSACSARLMGLRADLPDSRARSGRIGGMPSTSAPGNRG